MATSIVPDIAARGSGEPSERLNDPFYDAYLEPLKDALADDLRAAAQAFLESQRRPPLR